MAHARRKFHELHVTGKSQIAEQALVPIHKLYAIEAELRKKTDDTAQQRCEYRQQHNSQPVMQQLYEWLNQHHLTVAIKFSNRPGDQLQPKMLAGTLPLSG